MPPGCGRLRGAGRRTIVRVVEKELLVSRVDDFSRNKNKFVSIQFVPSV